MEETDHVMDTEMDHVMDQETDREMDLGMDLEMEKIVLGLFMIPETKEYFDNSPADGLQSEMKISADTFPTFHLQSFHSTTEMAEAAFVVTTAAEVVEATATTTSKVRRRRITLHVIPAITTTTVTIMHQKTSPTLIITGEDLTEDSMGEDMEAEAEWVWEAVSGGAEGAASGTTEDGEAAPGTTGEEAEEMIWIEGGLMEEAAPAQ